MSSYTNYNIYNKKQYFNKIRALNSQKKEEYDFCIENYIKNVLDRNTNIILTNTFLKFGIVQIVLSLRIEIQIHLKRKK